MVSASCKLAHEVNADDTFFKQGGIALSSRMAEASPWLED